MSLNRGYKLQEFVAHASDVKCVSIGKKSNRNFITGGEDRKVNLWAIGRPNPVLSLSGHMSSVESVAFDSAEVLVLGGSSNGIIKLWDLEEAKIVRTLTGHRSNCTSVEFHPFGEFFASGSLDTDLRIWDIRKKGCIHTYKGHTGGISKIRFTPDGRWVVTGGADNMVKLWDLTAGKLLHDFKFHIGPIRCIDFHPHEFLLATGSADQTVKFWDLETFELIGSAGPEATGVCSMIFHPDGKTLFCGLDATLKVFSWEPIRCHDAVDMGWTTLADLSVYEGKLLGCSHHENRIGLWLADISLIAPYALGVVPKVNVAVEPTYIHGEIHSMKSTDISMIPNIIPTSECLETGVKTKESQGGAFLTSDDFVPSIMPESNSEYESNSPSVILHRVGNKTSSGGNTEPQKIDSRMPTEASISIAATPTSVKVIRGSLTSTNRSSQSLPPKRSGLNSSTSKAISLSNTKRRPLLQASLGTQSPMAMPVVVPRDNQDLDSFRVVNTTSETISHGLRLNRPTHKHKPSFAASVSKGQLVEKASVSMGERSDLDVNSSLSFGVPGSQVASESDKREPDKTRDIAEDFERVISLGQHLQSQIDNGDELSCSSSDATSVKYVRGVAVQLGKTRTLVECWERREKSSSGNVAIKGALIQDEQRGLGQSSERDFSVVEVDISPETLIHNHDAFVNSLKSRLTKLQMVRHFWEQNGIKGAIGAVTKLPDYSVQVDVINILKEKTELFTLDLFSLLLPLFVGLLSSKVERQIIVTLSLLLELVKTFKPVITSTITASSSVGIDIQAEQRRERCTYCFNYLEKIKQLLPPLIRRGGVLAKHAGELNLVLHNS
ncbi:katanin p80 WD40 repeat-containing subunit B1 homolog KTN80.2-like isoform X2 [Zingiber officinale]|uniref:katanin p80 WD40 repeat-containing subunit B1 homolog KTN80.2-like isoform X2 n=1 Tax=Zingiber officinale TaxID=94328 RepID=UPI001C4B330E|nr:katanin p80 WD40 repeat-containing subunit B1 homolog KTN80.2-like isoform X2 [Zingiber officinale]